MLTLVVLLVVTFTVNTNVAVESQPAALVNPVTVVCARFSIAVAIPYIMVTG